jgi:hypothetical protein
MKLNYRTIFLFDGLGALASALTSGLVLPIFSELLGLPPWLFYGLAAIAVAFGIYSFSCYRLVTNIRPEYLLAVVLGNFSYCLVTLGLLLFYPTITLWGRIVLGGEIVVILSVIFFEIRVLKQSFLRG